MSHSAIPTNATRALVPLRVTCVGAVTYQSQLLSVRPMAVYVTVATGGGVLLSLLVVWVLVTLLVSIRIRQNRKRYRIGRANRSMRAWVNNGGKWYQ